jgi:intracellular septation protein
MQNLLELAPLLVFFGVYATAGIYAATAALMAAMLLLLAYDWLATRKLPTMHLVSAVLVWVFGAVTLVLRDVRFIQWKATVFYWLIALVLLGSVWIGRQTLLERLMAKAVPENLVVPPGKWRSASVVAALFYVAIGGVNLWVAYRMSEARWVFFKTWLMVPIIFVFTAGLMFWLLHGPAEKTEPRKEAS